MPVYMLDERVDFPDPENSDSTGLLAVGGDLSTERLLLAYRLGIFPWYSDGQPILWFSPDTRLIFYPSDFKASKSLKKLARSGKFTVKIDTQFAEVIENCAEVSRKNQDGTWITEEMKSAYRELHELGYAHSFETYIGENLVGGLYGISIGGAFFGESMFHKASNASKIAFLHLVEFCKKNSFDFIDSQVPTDHMIKMGGIKIDKSEFLKMLVESNSKTTLRGCWNFWES